MTAAGSFNVKGLFKKIIQRHFLELLPFCEVFNFYQTYAHDDDKNFTFT